MMCGVLNTVVRIHKQSRMQALCKNWQRCMNQQAVHKQNMLWVQAAAPGKRHNWHSGYSLHSGSHLQQPECVLQDHPHAGANVSSSPLTSLNMNALFQMFVVTEDTLYPSPNRQGFLVSVMTRDSCYIL